MQGAEMDDEGSVLKYMTKSEIEEQRSSLLIMPKRLVQFGWCRTRFEPSSNVIRIVFASFTAQDATSKVLPPTIMHDAPSLFVIPQIPPCSVHFRSENYP